MTDLKKNYSLFVDEYYRKGYFSGDPDRLAYVNYKADKPYIVGNMKKFLTMIQEYKTSGKLLDVGCALGYFVELALHHGYDAYGFDPSEYATEEAKKIAGDERIAKATIDTARYKPRSFDIITMFDVFEHLADPGKNLKKLRSLLKDDGILVIATGDTQSLMARVLKRRWTFFSPPQHLFFFNKDNIRTLFDHEGFTPVSWSRIGKWLSLGYVLHLARTVAESTVGKWLYHMTEGTVLSRIPLFLPLRDNMVVIVKKKL